MNYYITSRLGVRVLFQNTVWALFLLLVSFGQLNAQDFYYYQGRKIELTQRPDKLACVMNHGKAYDGAVKANIRQMVDADVAIKETGSDVLLLSYDAEKPASSVQTMASRLAGVAGVKFVTPAYYGDSKAVTEIATDEFVVRLKDKKYHASLEELNELSNCSIVRQISDERGFLIKSNDGVPLNALALSQRYLEAEIFEYAEPNFLYTEYSLLHSTPNDALYASQWAIRNTAQTVTTGGTTTRGDVTSTTGIVDADMDIDLAWDYVTGTGVQVAVFDTGIDSTHPDFAGQVLSGYDAYYDKNSVAADSGKHGTCTAGLIGAVANNSIGIAGIAYNAKVMSVRIFNAAGSSTSAGIARGFDTARVRNMMVLSNSWGGGTPATVLTTAIDNCALLGRSGKGCVILFSSGNDGRNPPSYPSYLSNVICVGASTTHDQKKASGTGNQYWWGGNYGSDSNGDLELTAPTVCYSVDVQGTGGYNTSAGTAGNYYDVFNGTSCSCPNAAGVAALVLSVDTSFTRAQMFDFIMRGCDKVDNVPYSTVKTYGRWNDYHGYGRINAYNSVRLAAGADVTPPTINHLQKASHNSTRQQAITAEILDQDGSAVPVTGVNQPKLFYRLNKNNAGWSAYDSLTLSSYSGNNVTFLLPCIGWQTEVQYYIRARDNSGNETYFPRGVNNNFPACYFAVCSLTTVSGKSPALTLPTQGSAKSANFTIGNYKILDMKLLAYIRHTYISDALFTIYGPGTDANYNRKCFFSHNGGAGVNITNASITDSATAAWRTGTAPYTTGTYYPEYAFRGYNGTSANGNWSIVYYDSYAGDGGTLDSIVVRLTIPSGTTSPCAQLNSAVDSTIDFGTVGGGQTVDRNFYLKNRGTATLFIDSIRFAGTYASKFSIVSSPASIAMNDSGLFVVRCTHSLSKNGEEDATNSMESAVMKIYNNDPSKTNFLVSLLTDNPLPVQLTSFTASVVKNAVVLKWRTAQEVAFFGWDIERKSRDAAAWEPIGSVRGAGNSQSEKNYAFTDANLTEGSYFYRLKQIDADGSFTYSNTVSVDFSSRPEAFVLQQNYPNPFNPATEIRFEVSEQSRVKLNIFALTGELVATLADEILEPGYYSRRFEAGLLPSGVYVAELSSDKGKSLRRKLTLMK